MKRWRMFAAVFAAALCLFTAGCGGESEPQPALLIKALEEPDAMTRLLAIEALTSLGSLAKEAVPALEQARQDANEDVRSAADEALKAIRG